MKITIYLTEDEHALVREAAALKGVSMRTLTRQSVVTRSRRVLSLARRAERNAAGSQAPAASATVRRGVIRRGIDAVLRTGRRA